MHKIRCPSPLIYLILALALPVACARNPTERQADPAAGAPPNATTVAEARHPGQRPQDVVEVSGKQPGSVSPDEADEADDPADAVSVVRDYYRNIEARDFRGAYLLWGTPGPPGQTFEEFQKGFADTAAVSAETGRPSPVGAAAGSRYVEVPVTVLARTRSGRQQRFEGTYTVRRSVVTGASAAQRTWHLYRASLHQVAARP